MNRQAADTDTIVGADPGFWFQAPRICFLFFGNLVQRDLTPCFPRMATRETKQ